MRSRYLAGPGAYPPEGLVRLPAAALGHGGLSAFDLLQGRLALQYRAVVSPSECAAWTAGVLAARQDWTSNFGGIQFTLGRAWYVHLEQDMEEVYFANTAASDAIVAAAVPGLRERMAGFVSDLVQDDVVQRPGWCGAGVHIFPAGGHCAQHGGDLHYDCEGLTDEQIESGAPALTCVLMLQMPPAGGGLRVWDGTYEGEAHVAPEDAPERSVLCAYQPGDAVVIESLRLHQIMPFSGPLDRISATIHAVYDEGRWQVWF